MPIKDRWVVPAGPGWTLLIPERENGVVVDFERTPVIAWHVEFRAEDAAPLVSALAARTTFETYQIIRTPDGGVVIPELGAFDSEAAVAMHLNTRREGP